MKPISKKQSAINRKRDKTYSEIDHEREPVCEGCGRSGIPLSHSHIISQKRAKYLHRTELIYDKKNISLDCFGFTGSCHEKTESNNYEKMKTLLNFSERIAFIKEHDKQTYDKIMWQTV